MISEGMIERIVRDNLLAIVATYRKATGKSLSQVSKQFYGNADFFEQLRAGEHSISVKKLSDMLDEFRANWPEETPWPPVRVVTMGRNSQRH